MEQLGLVEKADGKLLRVKIKRATACGENCASCGGNCSLTDKSVTAVNTAGAKEGDTVVLEMNSKRILLASFMVYILPIIVFIAVYFAVYAVKNSEAAAVMTGLVSMAAVFAADIIWDKKVSGKYKLEAVRIIG